LQAGSDEEDKEESDESSLSSVVVDVAKIEGFKVRQRMNKEQRLAHIKEGREGRDKFGFKPKKAQGSSKTNKQKTKNQPFMLARQSKAVRSKRRLSLKDKQKKRNKKRARR
jgi:protein SDA1